MRRSAPRPSTRRNRVAQGSSRGTIKQVRLSHVEGYLQGLPKSCLHYMTYSRPDRPFAAFQGGDCPSSQQSHQPGQHASLSPEAAVGARATRAASRSAGDGAAKRSSDNVASFGQHDGHAVCTINCHNPAYFLWICSGPLAPQHEHWFESALNVLAQGLYDNQGGTGRGLWPLCTAKSPVFSHKS